MNGLAVVSQGLLGESFGVAAGLGTLGPCIPVAVQCDPGYRKTMAGACKLTRPMGLSLIAVARKEWPEVGEGP